jgi:type IV pilus assembly protein PilB
METAPHTAAIKNLVSVDQAWFYGIVPEKLESGVLHLCIDDTRPAQGLQQELEMILGQAVHLIAVPGQQVEKRLLELYPKTNAGPASASAQTLKLNVHSENFLEQLVNEAKNLNSSDIHLETYDDKCRIRFRVDGVLIDRHKVNKTDYPTLINKIKIKAGCDIAEKRLPQDGRIHFRINNSKLDIRVSILPTLHGEKIVLRLLGSDASHLSVDKLGFSAAELGRYHLAVKKPNGIILISGPTGSGKTTTLYATLKQLNKPTANILTIEDPIEYTLDGINQVQLRDDIGLTYAEALRSFLRQDPDIIMLGEIRDAQTAQMAIRAALTGHLVLSTIHTNSAWGTISRLLDMGVPAYLLANTLNLSVAQRLVRTLCPHCKTKKELDKQLLPKQYRNVAVAQHWLPAGCSHCHYTGYKGRRANYEVIDISKELTESIKHNATNIDDYCRQNNIGKLADNALGLFIQGDASLDEIYPYLIHEN